MTIRERMEDQLRTIRQYYPEDITRAMTKHHEIADTGITLYLGVGAKSEDPESAFFSLELDGIDVTHYGNKGFRISNDTGDSPMKIDLTEWFLKLEEKLTSSVKTIMMDGKKYKLTLIDKCNNDLPF